MKQNEVDWLVQCMLGIRLQAGTQTICKSVMGCIKEEMTEDICGGQGTTQTLHSSNNNRNYY